MSVTDGTIDMAYGVQVSKCTQGVTDGGPKMLVPVSEYQAPRIEYILGGNAIMDNMWDSTS